MNWVELEELRPRLHTAPSLFIIDKNVKDKPQAEIELFNLTPLNYRYLKITSKNIYQANRTFNCFRQIHQQQM